jgi:hypothetical protein
MEGFLRISKRSHKSTRTAIPIATTVSTPFTLEPQAHAIKIPVAINQPHHSGVNGLQVVSKGLESRKNFEHTNIAVYGSEHRNT